MLAVLCLRKTLAHAHEAGSAPTGGPSLCTAGSRGRAGAGAGGESQTVGHRPSAQDVRAFPAGQASSAIRGSSPPLPDVNAPSREWVSSSVWEDTISVICPSAPHSNPGTSCLGRSEWTNEKAVGEGDSADVLLSSARGGVVLRGQMLPPRSSGIPDTPQQQWSGRPRLSAPPPHPAVGGAPRLTLPHVPSLSRPCVLYLVSPTSPHER